MCYLTKPFLSETAPFRYCRLPSAPFGRKPVSLPPLLRVVAHPEKQGVFIRYIKNVLSLVPLEGGIYETKDSTVIALGNAEAGCNVVENLGDFHSLSRSVHFRSAFPAAKAFIFRGKQAGHLPAVIIHGMHIAGLREGFPYGSRGIGLAIIPAGDIIVVFCTEVDGYAVPEGIVVGKENFRVQDSPFIAGDLGMGFVGGENTIVQDMQLTGGFPGFVIIAGGNIGNGIPLGVNRPVLILASGVFRLVQIDRQTVFLKVRGQGLPLCFAADLAGFAVLKIGLQPGVGQRFPLGFSTDRAGSGRGAGGLLPGVAKGLSLGFSAFGAGFCRLAGGLCPFMLALASGKQTQTQQSRNYQKQFLSHADSSLFRVNPVLGYRTQYIR